MTIEYTSCLREGLRSVIYMFNNKANFFSSILLDFLAYTSLSLYIKILIAGVGKKSNKCLND